MSTLIANIQSDLKSALKAGEKERVGALRFLISQVQYARIEKQDELTDDDVIGVLSRQARSRKESIEAFEQGGRDDLVAKERLELELIEGYLPEQLTEKEIAAELDAIITEEGLSGMGDLGKLMKSAMARLHGRVDGSVVSRMAKETLQGPSD